MASNKNIQVFWWSSVKFENKEQLLKLIDQFPNLTGTGIAERLSHQLMNVCPFKV